MELKKQFDIDIAEQTLRRWCMTGGICHEALVYVEQLRSAEVAKHLENVDAKLKETALDAIGILELGMANGITKNQLAAAESILDRSGFPKTSKIDGKQEVSVEASKQFTDSIVAIADSLKK